MPITLPRLDGVPEAVNRPAGTARVGADTVRDWMARGASETVMCSYTNRDWRLAVVAVAVLVLSVCGGGGKGDGTSPTIPLAPTPTPVAAPGPEPPPSSSCENLPLGSAKHTCRDESASFLGEVNDAIDALMVQHPEYFRGDTVTNIGGYYVGLIRTLDRKGLCATYDGEELAVKNTNDFSDQYKVLTSWNQIRRFYVGTCYPAVFPLARNTPAPSPPGCSLPPSSEIVCSRPDPQLLGVVGDAVDQVMNQRPELFDPVQKAPGTDWPLVKDMQAYHLAVVDALAKKGYCGRFDSEEIQIKRSNELSEHYDINYADKYIRRGPGIFRVACYPAAF